MVHIAEGFLPLWECVTGYVVAATILVVILVRYRLKLEDISRLGFFTTIFFIASFIHIAVGPSSVHPLLTGLVGVLVGPHSLLGIWIALLLQAILAGHGGLTTLGVNAVDMGLPAVLSYLIFKHCVRQVKTRNQLFLLGAGIGCFSVVLTLVLTSIALIAAGYELSVIVPLLLYHTPVIVVETVITGVVISTLARVRPHVLTLLYGEHIEKLVR